MNIVHYFLLLLGLIIAFTVTYWFYLYKKGFKSMTPMYFLTNMNAYIVIEIGWFIFVLFFLDISGMIIIPAYFFAWYLGNVIAEKKFKKTVKAIEEINKLDNIEVEENPKKKESILDKYKQREIEIAKLRLIRQGLVDDEIQAQRNLEMDLEERQQLALGSRKKQKSE